MTEFYTKEYYTPFIDPQHSRSSNYRFWWRMREIEKTTGITRDTQQSWDQWFIVLLDIGTPFFIRPNMIDVGCGLGDWIDYLNRHRWNACGVDTSLTAVDYGKQMHRPVYEHIIKWPHDKPNTHLITMWHVLEHVDAPQQLLAYWKQFLSSDGWLVVEVPNAASVMAKIMGQRWRNIRPEHLHQFTPQTLCQLLRESGFTVRRVQYTGTVGLTPLLERVLPKIGQTIKHALWFFPIKWLYLHMCRWLRLGDFVRVYARQY